MTPLLGSLFWASSGKGQQNRLWLESGYRPGTKEYVGENVISSCGHSLWCFQYEDVCFLSSEAGIGKPTGNIKSQLIPGPWSWTLGRWVWALYYLLLPIPGAALMSANVWQLMSIKDSKWCLQESGAKEERWGCDWRSRALRGQGVTC